MEEIVGPLIDIVKCIATPTSNCVNLYMNFDEDVNKLKAKLEELNRRRGDIASRISVEVDVRREMVSEEVLGWIQRVQTINDAVQATLEKAERVKWYRKACLGKDVHRKLDEVKEIHEDGNFTGSLGIPKPPALGIIIRTESLVGENSTKEEIWGYLMDDEVGMIGVCGIGGVGKTTIMQEINNDLVTKGRFQAVIWVVVSYPLNVFELQKKIVHAMDKKLREEEEMRRAAELVDIMGKVSFVLILDDVWEEFSLKNVGIPEPTVQTGCKIVITSRSAEVCKNLRCQIVEVRPLPPEESLNLFLDKVGRDVLQKVPGLEKTLNSIVEECDGLPLAIVVIAGSMRGVYDISEWRATLDELCQCVESVTRVEDKIFVPLRFSYDRLENPKIQKCFLYCSFFREDYEFSREELIEGWIDEGLIDELGSRQAAYDRGCAILNGLQRKYLLEECARNGGAKMHDVVRDMVIKCICPEFRYMVKAGMKLKKVPDESKWGRDLNKVSLMANYISEIPVGLTPKCPLLSTLILSYNPNLSAIPSSFFEDMVGLKVLDLSGTGIEALPDSISNLVNLSALRLRKCHSLKSLPSLAKLRALKKLDLYVAGIEVVPQGMEMLVSLEYLDLYCRNLKEIPTGILASLSSLQYLVVYTSSAITKRINIEEVARLSNLESLECGMEVQDFNYLVNKSKDFDNLTAYVFRLTTGERGDFNSTKAFVFRRAMGEIGIKGYGFSNKCQRKVVIDGWEIGEECVVLPDTLELLWISKCKNMKNMRCSLNKIVLLENATELRRCSIQDFKGIECIVELDSSSSSLLNKLEDLSLEELSNLSALVRVEGVATPPQIFSNLKYLGIRFCSAMRKLVPLELLQALQNLECIQVRGCIQMEEIIASSDSDASSSNKFTFTFPKLRTLILVELDQLKSICGGKGVMVCDAIEEIQIIKCPKLKRIPLQLRLLDDGQPSPPPCLKKIGIDYESKEWWESVVELDHPDAKNILQPFLKFTPFNEWRMM